MRVCIAAGGTGGHLLPGLSLGKALRARGHDVHFVVKKDDRSAALLNDASFASSAFYFEGFPRRCSWSLLAYPFLSVAALLSARRIVQRQQPDRVVGMGGYVSVPLGVWAVLERIPLVLHEQNARAGLANRLLAPWARVVGTSFEKTEKLPVDNTVCTGLPLRSDLVPRDPRESRRALGLAEDDFTVLIFGGSQGARALNRLVWDSLPMMKRPGETWQFIHLTGRADEAAARAVYAHDGRRCFVKDFYSDIATAYAAADVVVCRSGANTVMELHRLGKPALLIPYPFAADDHQTANARFLEAAGQARVLQEKELTPDRLARFLNERPDLPIFRKDNVNRQAGVSSSVDGAAEKLADAVESAGDQ